MATVKTNQKITCKNIDDARVVSDKFSNGIIILKASEYLVVNYKTYEELKKQGYTQVR